MTDTSKEGPGTSAEDPSFPQEAITAGLRRASTTLLLSSLKLGVALFVVVLTIGFATVFGFEVYDNYFRLPEEVQVPEITGKTITEASQALDSVGLRLSVSESRHTTKVPEKVIISQTPAAGRKVRKNREIVAVVSLGPELVEVPELRGKSLREARMILSNSRLKVGKISYKPPAPGQSEQIVNQKPLPGEHIGKAQPVNLQIQKGPGTSS